MEDHLEDLSRRRRALAAVFCDRPRELATLRTQFDRVANGGGPRAALIVGEPGRGKTRLVQEFYARLSTDVDLPEQTGGYWPDSLPRGEAALDIAAPLRLCQPKHPMPYLWWGFRLAPEHTGLTVLAGVNDSLAWHFEEDQLRQRSGDRKVAASKKAGKLFWGIAKIVSTFVPGAHFIPALVDFGDNMKDVIDSANDLRKIGQEHKRDRTHAGAARETEAQSSIADTYLALFESFYQQGRKPRPRLPAVIVVDDAHFLRHDASARLFIDKLAARAAEEKWPILFVATMWEREKLADATATDAIPRILAGHGVPAEEILLRPHGDLSLMVPAVLPGIGAVATQALVTKAGGNPRHLEQILLLAAASPELFDDGSPNGAFHANGLQRLLDKVPSYETAVRERFNRTPPAVKDTLSAASLQGNRFLTALTMEVLAALRMSHDGPAAIRHAEDPYALVVQLTDQAAEFSETVYRDVAQEGLEDRGADAVAAAHKALRDAVMARFADEPALASLPAGERQTLFAVAAALFEASAEPNERLMAYRALAMAAGMARAYSDYPSLRGVIARLETAWSDGKLRFSDLPFWDHFEVQNSFQVLGRIQAARAAARDLAARAEGSDDQSARARREYATGLTQSGEQERINGDVRRSADMHAAALALFRALAAELGTPESRRDVSVSLNNVAGTKTTLGAPGEALGLYEESLGLRRALAAELGTPESRRDVSVSLDNVAGTKTTLGAPGEALGLYEESLGLRRALAAELGTPESRRDVSVSLNNVARTKTTLGAPGEALGLYEESLGLSRALAAELGTPESRRDVAISCERLGDYARVQLHDPRRAEAYFLEALAIWQFLDSILGIPDTMRGTAVILSRLTESAEERDDSAGAKARASEGLRVARRYAGAVGDLPDARVIVGWFEAALSRIGSSGAG